MSKRKLDHIQPDCLFNNSNNFQQSNKLIKNINYNNQPVYKKKRTTRTNIQQIKLIVDDPSSMNIQLMILDNYQKN